MIFNRTIEDVENAKKIRLEKVQKLLDLTDEEVETLEKGFITYNTLNRIENAVMSIQARLNYALGYSTEGISLRGWSPYDYFYADDVRRILNNVSILKKSFLVYKDTPEVPKKMSIHTELNSIERILFDLDKMIAEVTSLYRECGAYECGGE